MTTTTTTNRPTITNMVEAIINLIADDEAEAGCAWEPGDIARFADLHDYVDANEYLDAAAAFLGWEWDGADQGDLDVFNDAVDRLDRAYFPARLDMAGDHWPENLACTEVAETLDSAPVWYAIRRDRFVGEFLGEPVAEAWAYLRSGADGPTPRVPAYMLDRV